MFRAVQLRVANVPLVNRVTQGNGRIMYILHALSTRSLHESSAGETELYCTITTVSESNRYFSAGSKLASPNAKFLLDTGKHGFNFFFFDFTV